MLEVFAQRDMLTRRDKTVAYAMEQIKLLTKDVLTDELLLLEIMAGGERRFRLEFLRHFRGLPVDDNVVNLLWSLFRQQYRSKFGTTKPSKILDTVHIPTPLSERELEDSWEHSSSSSDDARRYFGAR